MLHVHMFVCKNDCVLNQVKSNFLALPQSIWDPPPTSMRPPGSSYENFLSVRDSNRKNIILEINREAKNHEGPRFTWEMINNVSWSVPVYELISAYQYHHHHHHHHHYHYHICYPVMLILVLVLACLVLVLRLGTCPCPCKSSPCPCPGPCRLGPCPWPCKSSPCPCPGPCKLGPCPCPCKCSPCPGPCRLVVLILVGLVPVLVLASLFFVLVLVGLVLDLVLACPVLVNITVYYI